MIELPFFLTGTGTAVLFTSICLDLLLGDREELPHPVRFMGALINASEKIARAYLGSETLSGSLLTLGLVFGTYISSLLFFHLVEAFNYAAYLILSSAAVYFSISLRCLADEAIKVQRLLEQGDMKGARKQVSMLVSRDTGQMDEEDISKAAIETVAENLVDGIMSPFFYGALGGPALCICFKMISTLDSMIGYKNERYKRFGRLAARLDDIANFIPARLSVPITALCSFITGSNPEKVFSCVSACGHLHQSPNSGLPEAAFAAALNVKLGGEVSYHGKVRKYPDINRGGMRPSAGHIGQSVRLLYASGLLFFSILLVPGLVFVLS